MDQSKTVTRFLMLGLAASVVVGLGEWMLHYLPSGPEGEISMLDSVPLDRASKGHFLVVLGAPLYFAGYYGIRQLFYQRQAVWANVIFILGLLSFSIGGAWVSSRYFAAVVLQRSAGTADYHYYLQAYEDHYQILVWLLRLLVLGVSAVYVLLIVRNKINIPKWYALFNPIVLLALSISTLFWIKPLGVHLAPIAMNTTHFILFSLLLVASRKASTSSLI